MSRSLASLDRYGFLLLRVVVGLMLGVTLVAQLVQPEAVRVYLDALGYAGPWIPVLGLMVLVEAGVLLVLLWRPRAGLAGAGVVFALLAVGLVAGELHTSDVLCRDIEGWAGTGTGPLALVRHGALAGLAVLGATWRIR